MAAAQKHNWLLYAGGAIGAYLLWKNQQNISSQLTNLTTPSTGTVDNTGAVAPTYSTQPVIVTPPTAPVTPTPSAPAVAQVPLPAPTAQPVVSAPTAPVVLASTSYGAPNPNIAPQVLVGQPSQQICGPYGCETTSNFSQPTTGPVAYCMSKKPNWNQSQCEQRLAALVSAFNTDMANINNGPQWKVAANDHQTQYHDLTGVWLYKMPGNW